MRGFQAQQLAQRNAWHAAHVSLGEQRVLKLARKRAEDLRSTVESGSGNVRGSLPALARCAACEKVPAQLLLCGRCKAVAHCGRTCQVAHISTNLLRLSCAFTATRPLEDVIHEGAGDLAGLVVDRSAVGLYATRRDVGEHGQEVLDDVLALRGHDGVDGIGLFGGRVQGDGGDGFVCVNLTSASAAGTVLVLLLLLLLGGDGDGTT